LYCLVGGDGGDIGGYYSMKIVLGWVSGVRVGVVDGGGGIGGYYSMKISLGCWLYKFILNFRKSSSEVISDCN
jgi:hypothetical protein